MHAYTDVRLHVCMYRSPCGPSPHVERVAWEALPERSSRVARVTDLGRSIGRPNTRDQTEKQRQRKKESPHFAK